ncbi:MAG TPA: efflux RND transporter periplasmic adaptor subunit [Pelomicrobium sp.]|nr:efflux RND transporter periplasmic adaptor subunit [Pelomicrobium sp.]
MRKGLTRIVGIAAAVAVLALAVWAFLPKPVPVSMGEVARGFMRVTLDEEGEVRAYNRYVVAMPVPGRLLRLDLRQGDAVRAGDVVARIAPLPLSEREREEQVARVAAARALQLEAQQQVVKAEARFEQARRERERAEKLVEERFIAPQAAEQFRVAETAAAKDMDAARFRARSAAADVQIAEAGLVAFRAQASGGPLIIDVRAPVAGQVLQIPDRSERVLAAGAPVMTLGDPARFEIVVDYLTTDAVRIRAGMTMLLTNWGGGETLKARVRVVEPGAFTKISALGVEEQRTNVVADFVDPPGPLNDGYRVESRVVVWESDSALKVPVASLFRVGRDWAVFVVEDDRARRRVVEIGHRNAVEAEVLAGLDAGAVVVRHPPNELADGARVERRRTGDDGAPR